MNLEPQWVVGFVDGEGCFFVGINRHPEMGAGFQVLPEFRIVQHERDVQVLHALKAFFGGGTVRRNHGDRWELRIRNMSVLKEVVAFFERHPLKTRKQVDFLKFRKVLALMEEGAHLSREGLREIIAIAMQMNTGSRERLEEVRRSLETDEETVHPGQRCPDHGERNSLSGKFRPARKV